MDELIIDSIRVRSDLIGDYDKNSKIKGYLAEKKIIKVLRDNEDILTDYLVKHFKLAPYVIYMAPFYAKKYKKYLQDPEARKYIYEKYGDKQTCVEVLCCKVTDTDAEDCIRLYEQYQEDSNVKKLTNSFVERYIYELRLLLPYDKKKGKNL